MVQKVWYYKDTVKTISQSQQHQDRNKIIFTSYSKRNFYFRAEVSQFVLSTGHTPINPYMNFDYNLSGVVDKSLIRVANNSLIQHADELWVFGEISDGVLAEIYMARQRQIPIHFYRHLRDGVFAEVKTEDVVLEDVSDWLWHYMLDGKDIARWHPRLRFYKTYPLIYPAYSKRNFYLQMHISQYCLEHRAVPLNPFLLFRYFIGDSVPRETIYAGNNNLVRLSDEVWVFDEVSNGVLAEIIHKKEQGGKVKYFRHYSDKAPITYRQINKSKVEFEPPRLGDEDLEKYRDLL